jgi:hypothetical protein
VPRPDGTSRTHKARRGSEYACQGAGYRLARWPVGQKLRHHGGSVWTVERDLGGPYGDYLLRCVVGQMGYSGQWIEQPGKTLRAHGEYMHRHGWTPVAPEGETR